MNAVTSIALSALNAASLRVLASASNLANMNSNGAAPGAAGPAAYTPVEVSQTALAGGGVEASLSPSTRQALLAYDPSAPYADADGYVATPDVDPLNEILQLMTASYGFSAGLAVLRTSNEMSDAVLGIRA